MHGVAALPPSVTYTDQMSPSLLSTLGQFYLTAEWWFSGNIVVKLVATGDMRNEYSMDHATVTIVASVAPLPSPSLLTAVFGDNGASFEIGFDTGTDQAGMVADYWPCSQLFTFPGSKYTTCSWSDSSTVTGKFGIFDATKMYLSPGNCHALTLSDCRS